MSSFYFFNQDRGGGCRLFQIGIDVRGAGVGVSGGGMSVVVVVYGAAVPSITLDDAKIRLAEVISWCVALILSLEL